MFNQFTGKQFLCRMADACGFPTREHCEEEACSTTAKWFDQSTTCIAEPTMATPKGERSMVTIMASTALGGREGGVYVVMRAL